MRRNLPKIGDEPLVKLAERTRDGFRHDAAGFDGMDREAMSVSQHDWQAVSQQYLAGFKQLLDAVDLAQVGRVVDRLRRVRDRGGMVFIAGNGGSAATATHLVNDLGKATKRSGQVPMRVISLSDNVSWLTALANDEGYARAFSGQMENFAQAGDALIVISASGNSENLIDAVQLAGHRGTETIALLGFDGGRLKDMVDEALLIETEIGAYGPVESAHSVVCDLLTTCLMGDVNADRVPSVA
jgi:D-sedoheptulose 7-phosphate isomerase